MGQESQSMKLYTFARTKSECHGPGDYRDIQSITRFKDNFPPVFLTAESAKDWQQNKSNPLTNEDLLERFHWAECQIVELDLVRGTFITEVEKAAIAFANAFTAEKEDAAEVEKTVHALIEKLEMSGWSAA
jgi:hypothetical protein